MIKTDILLFGKPGSGKGTLAKDLISSDTSLVHLSTGEIFRAQVKQKTALGIEISETLASGELINDELTIAVVEDFLHNVKNDKYILFDGFPRNESQMLWLLNRCVELEKELPVFVDLQSSDDTCIERIYNRAILENREEDKDLKIIQKRLNDFSKITNNLKDDYAEYSDSIIELNAEVHRHSVLLEFYKKYDNLDI